MEEKDFIDKMGVYDVVPRSDATEIGCRVIRTRWVTVNKGSADAPQLRARWVAQEFRGRCVDKHEYYSETPDLALVKAVIAHAARRAESEDIAVAVFDVRRAYFCAEEKRDTFVELLDYVPAEFGTTHVGKLRKALYGTRPLAASWREELRKGFVSCSLTVGTVSRCCFHNELCSVAVTVHSDDIFVAGPRQVKKNKMGTTLKKIWETRDQVIGPKPGDQKELRILNRTLRWCKDGLVFAANLRHGRVVVEELGLSKSKPVSSPATEDGATRCQSDELEPLDEEGKRLYQRIVAKLTFLAHDRLDLKYATSCLASAASSPSLGEMQAAKRVGRFLRKALVAWQGFPFHDPRPGELLCYTDADWAADKTSRRSTSGGVVTLDGGVLNCCAKKQKECCTVKLGKSELFAALMSGTRSLGIQSELMDLWYNCSVTVATDSQSVIDHSRRRGHRVASKHVGLRGLWLHEALENRKMELEKVDTATNPADVRTKALPGTYAAVKKTWVTIPMNGI